MDTFDSESKGVRAQARQDGGNFVVLAGSQAVGEGQVHQSFRDRPRRVGIRNALIRDGSLVPDGQSYRFSVDVSFNSPSEAASIIWGSMLNGRKVFGLDEAAPESHVLHFQIDSARAVEGYKRDQSILVSERDRKLADQRKSMDGQTCQACGFRLEISG